MPLDDFLTLEKCVDSAINHTVPFSSTATAHGPIPTDTLGDLWTAKVNDILLSDGAQGTSSFCVKNFADILGKNIKILSVLSKLIRDDTPSEGVLISKAEADLVLKYSCEIINTCLKGFKIVKTGNTTEKSLPVLASEVVDGSQPLTQGEVDAVRQVEFDCKFPWILSSPIRL
jgi:hypothetical protein